MVEPFQVVLEAPVSAAQALEEGVVVLQEATPPLRRMSLHLSPEGDRLLLSLGFDDERAFIAQHRRVGELATTASGRLVDLAHASEQQRDEVDALRARWTMKGFAAADLRPVLIELRKLEPPTPLRVSFESNDALLAAYARQIAEGAIWVPTPRGVSAENFMLLLATPESQYADNPATRVHREPKTGQKGLWLEFRPGAPLQALIDRARERKETKLQRVSPKPMAHFETDLEVVLGADDLRRRWESELARGWCFVPVFPLPALRARVRVLVSLPDGSMLTLPGEVVHHEVSSGVGVQLDRLEQPTIEAIEALLAVPQRTPHVLVVEDEAIWRSTLQRVFDALGVRVTMAHDGHEGLVKLIDEYFDLDLVVLDLHMPELDGRGLIERVRRQGGEPGFKMFLFSAAARAELESVNATEVFSKLDPLDKLASRLAQELGKKWPVRH
ncbi:MAG TPA: response regulator, partial [Archangium sp.]